MLLSEVIEVLSVEKLGPLSLSVYLEAGAILSAHGANLVMSPVSAKSVLERVAIQRRRGSYFSRVFGFLSAHRHRDREIAQEDLAQFRLLYNNNAQQYTHKCCVRPATVWQYCTPLVYYNLRIINIITAGTRIISALINICCLSLRNT